jgi:hypothetical protein
MDPAPVKENVLPLAVKGHSTAVVVHNEIVPVSPAVIEKPVSKTPALRVTTPPILSSSVCPSVFYPRH